MFHIPVIARRELRSYFLSPVAYVVLTAFMVLHGLLFAIYVGSPGIDPDAVMAFSFWLGMYLMLVAAPVLSMGLISQEAREGTLEPLLTAPVADASVVMGKFYAALLFSISFMLPLILQGIFLSAVAQIDWGPAAAGFLGLYLLMGQFLAIGLFCSSLTRIQIGSAIFTFVILMALFFTWMMLRESESPVAMGLRYVTPARHFGNFVKGIVDTRSIVYFITTTALFLFLTIRSLKARKWR